MLASFLSSLSLIISLSTLSGVILHDTRLDKAAAAALTTPTAFAQYEITGKQLSFSDAHTHVERSSFGQAMQVYHQAATPGMQPRSDERKHLLQKYTPKGHHAFDNYHLPIV